MILSFIGLWMGHISDAPSSERESEPVALERPACKHVTPGHIFSRTMLARQRQRQRQRQRPACKHVTPGHISSRTNTRVSTSPAGRIYQKSSSTQLKSPKHLCWSWFYHFYWRLATGRQRSPLLTLGENLQNIEKVKNTTSQSFRSAWTTSPKSRQKLHRNVGVAKKQS